MNSFMEAIVTIALAITGVAIVATLVSRKAQTPQVIQSVGTAYSSALGVALAPVTGAAYQPNLAYPTNAMSDFTLPSISYPNA
jgi:hypothetical protein